MRRLRVLGRRVNFQNQSNRTRISLGVESLESRRCLTTGFQVSELACCDAGDVAAIEMGDIDGDGNDDVIVSSADGGGIAWYPNLGGTLGARTPIADGTDAIQLVVVDIDMDNDLDVVAGTAADDFGTIVWYQNNDGVFGQAKQVTNTPRGVFSMGLADLDLDSDLDLVWSSPNADSIAWHANDGAGNFASPKLVWASFDQAMDVELADVDGDGDTDVVGASFSFLDPKVSWFKNDGTGEFVEQVPVAEGVGRAWSIDAGDIDGDGDLDVVVSSYRGGAGEALKVVNEGGGVFAAPETVDDVPTLAEVTLVDLDGDDIDDLLATTTVGQQRAEWYRSQGDGSFEASRLLPVQTVGMSSIVISDFNGDDRNDIISNSNETGQLLVCESRAMGDSNGDGNFDSADIVAAFMAGLYETGQPATFDDGDWNGDGIFDTSDLVTAFQAGTYSIGAKPRR